ncbi:hypothetical protein N0V90_012551 [Kalmusia sp. IMI 367209]|nr:hypothetical protein N0V90_012551 [Kalmusia sp. IMI 367209]
MVATASVLLPLYIYPTSTSWQPLLDSAAAYPSLQFTVIVNPNSGPGYAPWWPNTDYTTYLAKLNALPNIHVVGYTDTAQVNVEGGAYTTDTIEKDIATYAARSTDATYPNIGVNGIFFDDVTNVYSDSIGEILEEVANYTKAQSGIEGSKTTIINPGTRPNFVTPNVDVCLAFENTWDYYNTADSLSWLAGNPYDRANTAYMIYAAPESQVASITTQLKANASYLYVTDNTANPWNSFGSTWDTFVAAMAAA